MRNMKWLRYSIAALLTALATVAAILLPEHIASAGDGDFLGQVQKESIDSYTGGYRYQMTASERLKLYLDYKNNSNEAFYITLEQREPRSYEIARDMVLTRVDEEIKKLNASGALTIPLDFTYAPIRYQASFETIVEKANPVMFFSIWNVEFAANNVRLILQMDAETGMIYDLSVNIYKGFDLKPVSAENYAKYLGLDVDKAGTTLLQELPDAVEYAQDALSGRYDIRVYWNPSDNYAQFSIYDNFTNSKSVDQ